MPEDLPTLTDLCAAGCGQPLGNRWTERLIGEHETAVKVKVHPECMVAGVDPTP